MKTLRKILAVFGGIITAFIAFIFVMPLAPIDSDSEILMLIYIILSITVPPIVFYFTARIIGWRLNILSRLQRLPRWFLIVIIATYVFTWVFGVPAVQTATNAEAVEAYKHEKDHNSSQVVDAHPWISTSAAFPLLPGLIVSYHEYQVAGLYGWGGWELHIWYFTGVKSIFVVGTWIS